MGKFEIRSSKFETNPKFEIRNLVCALIFFLGLDAAFTQSRRLEQPPPLSPAEGAREAKALVAEMLAERPEQRSTNVGVLKIRDGEGNRREIPLKIVTLVTRTNWLQIYEASATPSSSAITFTIVHTADNPNQYLLSTSSTAAAKQLTPAELMVPFAGSDFWLADLGYEFLHWAKQAVIKNDMRHSRACKVLESINPNPKAGGYIRVVCWITVEKPHAPVHADAYDASGRFKQFDPKNLEKVNGVYQIESVEMRNSKTGSHTVLEFDTTP
jgi:hypothetical protein